VVLSRNIFSFQEKEFCFVCIFITVSDCLLELPYLFAFKTLAHCYSLRLLNLKLCLQLFLACLSNLQAVNILNDIDKARLFSNIPDIYAANRHFWCQHLLPMLAESRKTGQPLNPQFLLDGFHRVRFFTETHIRATQHS